MNSILNPGKDAKIAAERQRREQTVANNRQLAASQETDARAGTSRRVPRGRKLYSTDAAQKSNLS
ncbi:MAG: hypothetical protein ACRCU5_13890 [Rhizobiaceae bacterium]